MANIKYFADIDGKAIELSNVWHDGHVSAGARHFSGVTPSGDRVSATRIRERLAAARDEYLQAMKDEQNSSFGSGSYHRAVSARATALGKILAFQSVIDEWPGLPKFEDASPSAEIPHAG